VVVVVVLLVVVVVHPNATCVRRTTSRIIHSASAMPTYVACRSSTNKLYFSIPLQSCT